MLGFCLFAWSLSVSVSLYTTGKFCVPVEANERVESARLPSQSLQLLSCTCCLTEGMLAPFLLMLQTWWWSSRPPVEDGRQAFASAVFFSS